jgi:hypothetical protein
LGIVDITMACAFEFIRSILEHLVMTSRYPNLGAFCTRAEALPRISRRPGNGRGDRLEDR